MKINNLRTIESANIGVILSNEQMGFIKGGGKKRGSGSGKGKGKGSGSGSGSGGGHGHGHYHGKRKCYGKHGW